VLKLGVVLNSTVSESEPSPNRLVRLYFAATGSRFWRICADVDPMLIAIALPWSTTAVILIWILWVFAIFPRLDRSFIDTLRHPVSVWALAMVGLASAGVIWAEGPFWARVVAISPAMKFLFLPLLFFHYQRSPRAHWVFVGFAASCTVLLAYSFLIYLHPAWQFTSAHGFDTAGVPIRNAIDQNHEFALCGFGFAAAAVEMFRRQRHIAGAALIALAALFFVNIAFVALTRTSLVYIVPLAALFVLRFSSHRTAVIGIFLLFATMVAVWSASPYLRNRVQHIAVEYQEFRETNRPTSTGQRLQYWSSSVEWIREAPLIGHGTGSAKRLFDEAAANKTGAWGDKIGNPHNQVLYVAIQWGVLGCIVLVMMWYQHYRYFCGRGLIAWLGTIIVLQNVLSSMFNSHLFDFTEGWIYVLGVAAAAGAASRSATKPP
jgi:O-antigen ligase